MYILIYLLHTVISLVLLNLAAVPLFFALSKIFLDKIPKENMIASQSSTNYGMGANRAIDGNEVDTQATSKSCVHTKGNLKEHWWRVIFPYPARVYSVDFLNRMENVDCCSFRSTNMTIWIILKESPLTYKYCGNFGEMKGVHSKVIICEEVTTGIGIELQRDGKDSLNFCEVTVFGRWVWDRFT